MHQKPQIYKLDMILVSIHSYVRKRMAISSLERFGSYVTPKPLKHLNQIVHSDKLSKFIYSKIVLKRKYLVSQKRLNNFFV